jgi:hypothetical protein
MTIEARGTVAVGGTIACMARIVDIETNTNMTITDVSTVVYTVYAVNEANQSRTPITDQTAISLTPADVFYDSLQTDAGWTEDSTGFNFRHIVDISTNAAFATVNVTYVVEYTVTPDSGQKIIVPFRVVAI